MTSAASASSNRFWTPAEGPIAAFGAFGQKTVSPQEEYLDQRL